jgi:hypothetical protein
LPLTGWQRGQTYQIKDLVRITFFARAVATDGRNVQHTSTELDERSTGTKQSGIISDRGIIGPGESWSYRLTGISKSAM